MKKYIGFAGLMLCAGFAFGQATIMPSKPQATAVAIVGASIHTGAGQVIENGYISFENGKITGVGKADGMNFNSSKTTIINAKGKHVYPGFIATNTSLGLIEVEMGAKGTDDQEDVGLINPHIRSIIAYNTDSKVIPTLRSNGILMAEPTPAGGLVSGQSSVVVLDGWNWEDAAYKKDIGIHMNWPVLRGRGGFGQGATSPATDPKEAQQKQISDIENYFIEARAYSELAKPAEFNSRFDAMKGLFNGSKKLFVHVNGSKDIIMAVQLAKKFGMSPVIVGGTESYLVTDFLRNQQVPVVIIETQTLPDRTEDDVYLPYKLPKLLQDGGVLYALTGTGYWRQRNLPFEAGTAVAYGLTKEQALSMISLNPAKILGIDKTSGSLEKGKDATLFISDGDALDMLGNKVEAAFILGRTINLDNLHKQLYKRYSEKYELK
ncbi:amidohydrolase family protein [Daejeonella sp.]|uniref:amidohydrolase family protein n=1 Tax=Daejeonella sp. TaxID=2805397 RepID=UPI0037C102E3